VYAKDILLWERRIYANLVRSERSALIHPLHQVGSNGFLDHALLTEPAHGLVPQDEVALSVDPNIGRCLPVPPVNDVKMSQRIDSKDAVLSVVATTTA